MKPYSLTEIRKYLQGELSPAEMHALEKAALQDAFLADAIEGYRAEGTEDADRDLADLHAQLYAEAPVVQRNKPERFFAFSFWKAAAAVILVAGASAIGLYTFNHSRTGGSNLAHLEKKQSPVQTDTSVKQEKSAESLQRQSIIASSKTGLIPSKKLKPQPSVAAISDKPVTDLVSLSPAIAADSLSVAAREAEVISALKDQTIITFGTLNKNGIQPIDTNRSKSFIARQDRVSGRAFFKDSSAASKEMLNDAVLVGKGKPKEPLAKVTATASEELSVSRSAGHRLSNAIKPAFAVRVEPVDKTTGISPKRGWEQLNADLTELMAKGDDPSADSVMAKVKINEYGTVIKTTISGTPDQSLRNRIAAALKSGSVWSIPRKEKNTIEVWIYFVY